MRLWPPDTVRALGLRFAVAPVAVAPVAVGAAARLVAAGPKAAGHVTGPVVVASVMSQGSRDGGCLDRARN
ncbi:hypothetical protein [Gordonia oryzae]|uniref:hypothetical protein n=1 Tax=Gordonia oryzae TaxID=2487349 RepID=UPI001FE85EC5|nr:hypothetical protein [Gordonia oryzae]